MITDEATDFPPNSGSSIQPKRRPPKIFSALLRTLFGIKSIITITILFILAVIEFKLDVAEVIVGRVLEWTNPLRPRAGTIWEYEKRDRLASVQLEKIVGSASAEQGEMPEVRDLFELRANLEQDKQVILSAAQFLELYNQLPPQYAQEIIAPFELLKITHSGKWFWTKIQRSENELSFYFLDGDNQLIMDTYPGLAVLYNMVKAGSEDRYSLENFMEFSGRIVSANQFYQAFNPLSTQIKLQLVNNPFQLLKWGDNLKRVAISRYSVNNTVELGFEVSNGMFTEVHRFQASELAATYLIAKINEMFTTINLDMPEARYRENSNP